MTDELVTRAKAALEGVTAGRWEAVAAGQADNLKEVVVFKPTFQSIADAEGSNARFIAFARQWVPEAAARIEADAATIARLEGERDEAIRRRDAWKARAEGYDAVRLALREKVGAPWPPSMSRIMWAGMAADEKKRADDAEAKVAALVEAATQARDYMRGGPDTPFKVAAALEAAIAAAKGGA